MNIYQHIASHSVQQPDKTAIVYEGTELSYQALIHQIDVLAEQLNNIEVSKHSRVALFCGNNLEFVFCLLAIAKLGAAIVPLPLTLKGEALKSAIKGADCDFAIAWFSVGKKLIEQHILPNTRVVSIRKVTAGSFLLEDLLSQPLKGTKLKQASLDSDFILTLTSGSTGTPKPIVFSQQTKIKRAFDATANYYQLTNDDVVLVSTPMYHSLAQRSVLMPLMLGARVVILPKFSINAWLKAVTEQQVSFLFAVSSQLTALLPELSQAYDFSSLRCIVSSSATLAKSDKDKLINVLKCRFHECYGASEVGVVTDFEITDGEQPLASVGKALPGVKVKVCDAQRTVLANGEIGEIACLTPTRFKGYFNLAQKTAESFDQDGYFYTGDLGYLDEREYLYYVGRTKEVIKSGGINVYPQDIEQALASVQGVKECAAIGVPDEQFGEVLWFTYVLEPDEKGFDESLLVKRAMAELTDYQLPRKYIMFDEFPKSALGKILKPEIKKQLQVITK